MKVDQFRKMLAAAEQMHRDSGNVDAAQALRDISDLLPERGAMTVAAFVGLVAKASASDNAPT